MGSAWKGSVSPAFYTFIQVITLSYEFLFYFQAEKNLMMLTDSLFLMREPYGVALVIGAWNYPVQLVFLPVIGAIAAGAP